MQFRYKLVSIQQIVIDDIIHFKLIVSNFIKTKQLLSTLDIAKKSNMNGVLIHLLYDI